MPKHNLAKAQYGAETKLIIGKSFKRHWAKCSVSGESCRAFGVVPSGWVWSSKYDHSRRRHNSSRKAIPMNEQLNDLLHRRTCNKPERFVLFAFKSAKNTLIEVLQVINFHWIQFLQSDLQALFCLLQAFSRRHIVMFKPQPAQ